MTILMALGLGLMVGAQHAFEPDHLAAVGTMIPESTSLRRAAARGAWWGLGHGASIAAIGAPLVLLGLKVPEPLEATAEIMVAVMLLGLGLRALWRAWRKHQGAAPASHRALFVGLLHGLAGSGAAVILATTQAPTTAASLLFLALFIVGSTLSMSTAAYLLSQPLRRLAPGAHQRRWLLGLSGLLSITVGILWATPHLTG